MAKAVATTIRWQTPGGQATAAPPVGPGLGQNGIQPGEFVNQFNSRTQDRAGVLTPVVVTLYTDRSYTFEVKSPPAATLLKMAAGIAQGSTLRNRDGQYLMAAYAPVESDEGEVTAVLAVEGAADLFDVLDDLRGTMVAVAIGSALGTVLLGLVLVRTPDSLARAERALPPPGTPTSMGRMAAG